MLWVLWVGCGSSVFGLCGWFAMVCVRVLGVVWVVGLLRFEVFVIAGYSVDL